MTLTIEDLLAIAHDDAHGASEDLVIRYRFIEGDILVYQGDGGLLEFPDAQGDTLEEALTDFLAEPTT